MARPQRRRVAAVLGLAAAIAALPGCSSQSGPNSCAYHDDGECDEPASGTGVCRNGTDYADCVTLQNSCQYAHNGECDEPGPAQWGRTGRCASGTDSDDCCPEHAHSSAGQVACTCNYNYRANEDSQTCVPLASANETRWPAPTTAANETRWPPPTTAAGGSAMGADDGSMAELEEEEYGVPWHLYPGIIVGWLLFVAFMGIVINANFGRWVMNPNRKPPPSPETYLHACIHAFVAMVVTGAIRKIVILSRFACCPSR